MYRILYVDDEPGLLEIGKIFLEQHGEFIVDTITSAPAALDLLDTGDYDAIISDYQMPEMDGIDFLKTIRASGKPIPFILFTGRGREEVVIRALNEGADFYLQKGGEPKSQFTELSNKIHYAVIRRRAEESLKQNEAQLRQIIDLVPHMIFAKDRNGTFLLANRAIACRYNTTPSGLVGKSQIQFHQDPVDLQRLLNDDREVMATGTTKFIPEERYVDESGNPHILQTTKIPFTTLGNNQQAVLGIAIDITERKEAEVALRESEERYRRIVETTDEGILQMDRNWKITYINRHMADMLNYSPEETIGRSLISILSAEDLADNAARIKERRQGKSGRYERRFITKDGKIRWMQVSATPITDPDGTFRGSFAMCSDITDHKTAEGEITRRNDELHATYEELHAAYEQLTSTEEELRQNYDELAKSQELLEESEHRYRNVIEDQTEFICRFLPDGTHVFVNNAYCRHFGMKPEEIIGHRFRPKILAEDLEHVKRFFASLTPDHPIDIIEHRIIMPDGTIRWQRWSDRAIFDHSGTVTEYQSVGRDITEEKATRTALEESEEKFRSFVENADDIIFSMTPAGIFTYVSPRLKDLLGYNTDELTGRSFKHFIHPDDLPAYQEFVQQTRIPDEKKSGIDYRIRHKNGTWLWHTTTISLIRDTGENVISFLGISRDISGHRKSEEALRRANRQLSLLSGITRHDILNKITGILGYLQLAELKSRDPDIGAYLEKMESAITEIQAQIEFTRIYQDLGTNEPQWIEVNKVLPRSSVPATITLNANVRDVELFADPMLEKIFFNLLDNSIRHGQRVTEIQVLLQKAGEDLVVLWEDNGIGISADEKERIFERGFGKNTGLGLFLIREILSLTGITIHETGEPGNGVRFEMLVPKRQYRCAGSPGK